MGNTIPQSTATSNANTGQNNPSSSFLAKSFPHFIIENTFPPGSGRVFRSFRVRCPTVGAGSSSLSSTPLSAAAASTTVPGAGSPSLVCKVMILRHTESKTNEIHAELARKAEELQRLKDILKELPNVCSYQKWYLSSNPSVDNRANIVTQPIFLFRQHSYSTLSDRLTMRPFLTNIEKIWIAYQILRALSSLHEHDIFHGNLTAENVCITSWGWVCIVDIGGNTEMKPVKMKDYDPSDFIYYYKKGEGVGQGDGRTVVSAGIEGAKNSGCYLAPERFYRRGEEENQGKGADRLTANMDVFAAGCIIIEMYLNGEKALDLGDLMEYRSKNTLVPSLKQKLNKIESSNIRAACKHMLSLDPSARLSAKEYLQKLSSGKKPVIPICFEKFLWPFMKRFQNTHSEHPCWTHDAKVTLLGIEYGKGSLRCLMEKEDIAGERYFREVLGPTVFRDDDVSEQPTILPKFNEKSRLSFPTKQILAETEALLEALESRTLQLFLPSSSADDDAVSPSPMLCPKTSNIKEEIPPSPQSLILILQFLLSSIRHVHRPSAKLLSLQLILNLNRHVNDETRLQRILPSTISLLDDTQALIRAQALRVLTEVLECIESFSPSDAQLFPKYVMKRIQHLATTKEDEVVRVAFAECVGRLAATSKRFLDISHVMRMQDALDGGGGTATTAKDLNDINIVGKQMSPKQRNSSIPEFPDDVAQLLGAPNPKSQNTDDAVKSQTIDAKAGNINELDPPVDAKISTNTTLIPNTYDEEFLTIQDSFTSLITHLTISSSSHIKRALLLSSLSQLALFFGEEGTITRLLPTILTFWNDLDDWDLRAALCQSLPSICNVIGRVGTEEFVLPCIEVACVDEEEGVVGWAIWCLAALVREKLIRGKALLLGNLENREGRVGVLEKYACLLIHPSGFVRDSTLSLFCASCKAIGFPDDEVFVLPILRPFLKYEPSRAQLQKKEELKRCLLPCVSRKSLLDFIEKLRTDHSSTETPTEEGIEVNHAVGDVFHSINIDDSSNHITLNNNSWEIQSERKDVISVEESDHNIVNNSDENLAHEEELRLLSMKTYLEMGQKRSTSANHSSHLASSKLKINEPENNILLSEAYSFAVPNQKFVELVSKTLPDWYENVRALTREDQNLSTERTSLKSLRSLAQVYGLSVTLPSNPSQPIRKWRGDFSLHESVSASSDEEKVSSQEDMSSFLSSNEAKLFDAARKGEFGATATLDPSYHDASILELKMQSLGVPSLPPKLGVLRDTDGRSFSWHGPVSPKIDSNTEAIFRSEWKPKVDSLVVSSTENMEHTAAVSRLAVSHDQSFFVSASHDGTCRVWELRQLEDAVDLQSSLTYSGHCAIDGPRSRINDACIVENSHSIASAASTGSVHIWRVDMSSSKTSSILSGTETQVSQADTGKKSLASSRFYETSRVSGTTLVRDVDPKEGEILAVSHFNTSSASVVSFATQLGIHSWDLRCAAEPYFVPIRPELGYLTSMAIGNDRNWMVAGTSRGYLALWDIRFRSMVKLWQHSSAAPVARLATCFTTLPQDKNGGGEDRPFIFMGCGLNEAAIFDVSTGDCRQCFRVLDPALCYIDQKSLPLACVTMPTLNEISLPPNSNSRISPSLSTLTGTIFNRRPPPEPSMQSIMGRIGKRGQSYIITGGSDRYIRYWDFISASRCYTVSGFNFGQPKPSFESVDVGSNGQLFLCRQAPTPAATEIERCKLPKNRHRGPSRPDNSHQDAVLDLKNIDFPVKGLLSCSRDGVIKMWR